MFFNTPILSCHDNLLLQANVMLEYTLEGAEELLCKNLQMATRNLTELNSDLDFLRDQITTTEVSILFAIRC